MRIYLRLLGRWRMLWGLCPACNSDAPEIDGCRVCLGFRWSVNGGPPPKEIKAWWWEKFERRLAAQEKPRATEPRGKETKNGPESNSCD